MSWREQLDVGELTVSKLLVKDPSEQGETVFLDVQADDLETALQVSGDVDTGLNLTGAMTTGISISGAMTDGIKMTAVGANDGIDITGVTGGGKAFRAGSYSSMLSVAGATTEVVTVGATSDEDDFVIGYGSYIRTSGEDGKGFGAAYLVEATNTTGTPTVQGMQSMAFLGSVGGSEAAILKTRGGDTTAGLTAGWFKIGCNTNCTLNSGSYSSVIWLDSQLHGSGNLNGTHYHIFCSTDNIQTSVLGFNGTGGYTNFIHTDSDANKTPFDGGAVDSDGNDSDGSIKISLNGTTYYIPYYAVGKLA